MNNLNQYLNQKLKITQSENIQEKLVISKNLKKQYKYHPQDRNELFSLCLKLEKERGKNADLNDIDVSSIINMSMLFQGSIFNGDISKWDVSNVTDMHKMFAYSEFNGDISSWNVNKNVDMEDMFIKCPLKNNPPKWYHE